MEQTGMNTLPATCRLPRLSPSLIVSIAICIAGCAGETRTQAAAPAPGPARITYYSDARGVFTLTPPPERTGHTLTLRGSCSLPEIILQVSKKGPGLPARNAVHRSGGRPGFSVTYLLKDGAGDYEVVIYGKRTITSRTLAGLCSFSVRSMRGMPANTRGLYINDRVLAFVDRVMGKTVGGGECWDLAQEALDSSGADWVRPFGFGKHLDPERDRVTAGDIIQFRSVRLRTALPGGGVMSQNIGEPDHTAIITGVEGDNVYRLAQQNSGGKRYVAESTVDLNRITSGSYRIYRPVAGILQ